MATKKPRAGTYSRAIYELQEALAYLSRDPHSRADLEEIRSELETLRDAAQDLVDTLSEKADNVEERFPGGCPLLDTLQARNEACETSANALDEAVDMVTELLDDDPNDEDNTDPVFAAGGDKDSITDSGRERVASLLDDITIDEE